MRQPTDSEWHDLLAAFETFCQAAPWRWMTGWDVVAVEHPANTETGYGVVLGNGGQEFGLALYIGDAGLAGYLAIMSDQIVPESWEALLRTNALSAMMVERKVLEPADRAVLRRLGAKIKRGSNWPFFRSARPGFLPWYLEGDEAVFLTIGLRSVLDVALRSAQNQLDLDEGDLGAVLARVFRDGDWHDEWWTLRPPAPSIVPDYAAAPRLQRLADSHVQGQQVWEFGVFYVDAPIQEKEGERPYFPVMALVVDSHSGLILNPGFLGGNPSSTEVQDVLVATCERTGSLPAKVLVDSAETARVLRSVTEPLGIELSVGVSDGYEELKHSLMDSIESEV